MTRAEDQLSELLHEAAGDVADGVSFEAVARRVRRHRWLAAGGSATAVAALTAGAVITGPALTGHRQDPAAARNHHPARFRMGGSHSRAFF